MSGLPHAAHRMPERRERRRRAAVGRGVGRLPVTEQPIPQAQSAQALAWRSQQDCCRATGDHHSADIRPVHGLGLLQRSKNSSTSSSNPLFVEASRSGRSRPHIWLSFLVVTIVAVVAQWRYFTASPWHAAEMRSCDNNSYSKCRPLISRLAGKKLPRPHFIEVVEIENASRRLPRAAPVARRDHRSRSAAESRFEAAGPPARPGSR